MSCPTRPPNIVAVKSNQSHLLPYNLSFNYNPIAAPITPRIVSINPKGIAYSACFILLLSNNHILKNISGASENRTHDLLIANQMF